MKYHIEIGWNWTKIEIAGSTQMPTLIIAITHIEVSIYTNHRTIVVSEKEQNKKQNRADRISLLTNWYWQWERKKMERLPRIIVQVKSLVWNQIPSVNAWTIKIEQSSKNFCIRCTRPNEANEWGKIDSNFESNQQILLIENGIYFPL